MTYTRKKPDSGPSPFLDAPLIQDNFFTYDAAFTQNHVSLNQRNQGCHSQIIFERQSSDPSNINDEVAVYNKNATSQAGTQPQLFIKIPKFLPTDNDTTNATNASMQVTYNTVNIAGPQYQSFLIGRYLIFFGTFSGMTSGTNATSTTITLSPVPTKIVCALASPNTSQTGGSQTPFTIATDIISNSQFIVRTSGNNQAGNIAYSFTYTAIGTV